MLVRILGGSPIPESFQVVPSRCMLMLPASWPPPSRNANSTGFTKVIRPAKAKMLEMSSSATEDMIPKVMSSVALRTAPLFRSTDEFRGHELGCQIISDGCTKSVDGYSLDRPQLAFLSEPVQVGRHHLVDDGMAEARHIRPSQNLRNIGTPDCGNQTHQRNESRSAIDSYTDQDGQHDADQPFHGIAMEPTELCSKARARRTLVNSRQRHSRDQSK